MALSRWCNWPQSVFEHYFATAYIQGSGTYQGLTVKLEVTPKDWAIAAYMGEARRRSNERKRKSNRDRGFQNNVHVDLQGSIGELLALKAFEKYLSTEELEFQRSKMFSLGGGSQHTGADFYLDQHPSKLRLDIKTFDCQPNKRFFAINAKKHEKLRGDCDGYSCLLIPKYGTVGFMVPIISHDEVDSWDLKALGHYGDPSRNIPVGQLLQKHAKPTILATLRGKPTISRDAIRAELGNQSVFDEFIQLCPDAETLFH